MAEHFDPRLIHSLEELKWRHYELVNFKSMTISWVKSLLELKDVLHE